MSQPNEVLCSDMTLQYICVYMTMTVTSINHEVVELMEMEIILSFNKHAAVIMHETLYMTSTQSILLACNKRVLFCTRRSVVAAPTQKAVAMQNGTMHKQLHG